MKVYHVVVERSGAWLAAHALEDDSVHTQAKTLDEITANIREVAELLCGERDIEIELVIPSAIKMTKPGKRMA
ncbi:MAG TPA: hypothetical protein VGM03_22655 [Phycisphaerae bacterium]|jgi:predicted RNase H-like HicB family nuclease